jgi:hypothetical protein
MSKNSRSRGQPQSLAAVELYVGGGLLMTFFLSAAYVYIYTRTT